MTLETPSRAERQRRVEEAIHSGEMEGLSVSPATLADAADYIDGVINSGELVNRTRARYGLTDRNDEGDTMALKTEQRSTTGTSTRTPAQVAGRLAYADAALALAGHEVTDEWSRNVLERAARHEISGDEAVAEIRRHFQG